MNILTLNSGSSSLKACLFLADGGRIDAQYPLQHNTADEALADAFTHLRQCFADYHIDAIGHRFVHGGDCVDVVRRLDDKEIARLENIRHLAPLHMPVNLRGVYFCRQYYEAPQYACFDTAFHQTLPENAWRLPIPQRFDLRRYGFHGINYAHIAGQLPTVLGEFAYKKVLIAHLGSGASVCLLQNLQSVATSMGYTPAGGIPMATRSGDLDPGVMLALAEQLDQVELTDLVFHQMGLLALSDGESADMATLLNSKTPQAAFAVNYFCQQVSGAIGYYAACSGGLDAIVFTAGIGEHAASIRQKIMLPLAFMGFTVDSTKNDQHQPAIHSTASKPILIIAADEENEMASQIRQYAERAF